MAVAPEPLRLHEVGLNVPDAPPLLNETLPVGGVAPEGAVSVTVAVQLVDALTAVGFGEQTTEVVVSCVVLTLNVTVSRRVPPGDVSNLAVHVPVVPGSRKELWLPPVATNTSVKVAVAAPGANH